MNATLAVVALLFVLPAAQASTPVHACSEDAIGRASKLLTLHFGADDRMQIDHDVKLLAPMKNPANPNQKFDVLEVWGYIYKGRYRMRFIYAQVPKDCVLMGQEILEFASL